MLTAIIWFLFFGAIFLYLTGKLGCGGHRPGGCKHHSEKEKAGHRQKY